MHIYRLDVVEITEQDEQELNQNSSSNLTFRQTAIRLFHPENNATMFSYNAVRVLAVILGIFYPYST